MSSAQRHLSTWLFLVALGGCGVHVGNGLRKYNSPLGFEVTYIESLFIHESADKRQVTISDQKPLNSARATTTSGEVSYAEFKINPDERAGTVQHLKDIAAVESGRTFEEAPMNGSIAIKSIDPDTAGRFFAQYYFVTTNHQVVRLRISATAEAKEKFTPIGESYRGGGSDASVVPTLKRIPHHHTPSPLMRDAYEFKADPALRGEPKVNPAPLEKWGRGVEAGLHYDLPDGQAAVTYLVKYDAETWKDLVAAPATERVDTWPNRAAVVEKIAVPGRKTWDHIIVVRATNAHDLHVGFRSPHEEASLEMRRAFLRSLHFKQPVSASPMVELVKRLHLSDLTGCCELSVPVVSL